MPHQLRGDPTPSRAVIEMMASTATRTTLGIGAVRGPVIGRDRHASFRALGRL